MTSITIRNLDDKVKTRLRIRAAQNHRSMEEEARVILGDAVNPAGEKQSIVDIARKWFGPENGIDLELPPRTPMREPPSFD